MKIQQLPFLSHQPHVKSWFKAYMSIIMIYGMFEQTIWPKKNQGMPKLYCCTNYQ